MFKLVAASTLVLSALAASIPFGHASDGCPGGAKCGMAFAPAAEADAALVDSARRSVQALALAGELAHYGESAQSPAALLVAARMIEALHVSPIPDSPMVLLDDADLLARARSLAEADDVMLAMIDDELAEQDRGSVFAVAAYDGQGGESWVDAGDSALFTRRYTAETAAVLTLVSVPDAGLDVRVVDDQGALVCEGEVIDGAQSCVWPAEAGLDYAVQVSNRSDMPVAFTIWIN